MNNDDVLRDLLSLIEKEESGTSMLNVERVNEFQEALRIIQELFGKKRTVKIEYKLHDPYPSMAYIRIIGKEIKTNHASQFQHALTLASNLLVTPLLNGKIQMDLTFYGITTHISEE